MTVMTVVMTNACKGYGMILGLDQDDRDGHDSGHDKRL